MTVDENSSILKPTWQCPPNVKAMFLIKKQFGNSALTLQSFLSTTKFKTVNNFKPYWMRQTHSSKIIKLPSKIPHKYGDAIYTSQPNQICAVQVADCVPILLADRKGKEVSAIHSGWKGIFKNIVEKTICQFHCEPSKIIAWVGPSISIENYEVKDDFQKRFSSHSHLSQCFEEKRGKKFFNLSLAVKTQLNLAGLRDITVVNRCVFKENKIFHSFRRDQTKKRMIAFIWIEK